jgi:hypothetical protein
MRRHGLRRDLASCCSDRLTQKVKQSWPRSILQPYTSLRTRKQRYTAMEKRYTDTMFIHPSLTNQIQTKSRSLKLRGNTSQRSRAAAKPRWLNTQHSPAQIPPPQPPTAQTSTCLRARVHTHTHCTHMRSRCRYHPVPRWRPRATAPSTRARKSAAVQH